MPNSHDIERVANRSTVANHQSHPLMPSQRGRMYPVSVVFTSLSIPSWPITAWEKNTLRLSNDTQKSAVLEKGVCSFIEPQVNPARHGPLRTKWCWPMGLYLLANARRLKKRPDASGHTSDFGYITSDLPEVAGSDENDVEDLEPDVDRAAFTYRPGGMSIMFLWLPSLINCYSRVCMLCLWEKHGWWHSFYSSNLVVFMNVVYVSKRPHFIHMLSMHTTAFHWDGGDPCESAFLQRGSSAESTALNPGAHWLVQGKQNPMQSWCCLHNLIPGQVIRKQVPPFIILKKPDVGTQGE